MWLQQDFVGKCQVNCNAELQGKQEKQMQRKTEIEIELSETVAYSKRRERFEAFCPQCQSLVEMSTPQVAVILTHSTEREIYRLVEKSKVHFVETDRVLICLKFLIETLLEPPTETSE
jgi:hypothetical protein